MKRWAIRLPTKRAIKINTKIKASVKKLKELNDIIISIGNGVKGVKSLKQISVTQERVIKKTNATIGICIE